MFLIRSPWTYFHSFLSALCIFAIYHGHTALGQEGSGEIRVEASNVSLIDYSPSIENLEWSVTSYNSREELVKTQHFNATVGFRFAGEFPLDY